MAVPELESESDTDPRSIVRVPVDTEVKVKGERVPLSQEQMRTQASNRELLTRITQGAKDRQEELKKENDELKKENDDLRDELRLMQTSFDDGEDMTPGEEARVHNALQKQAKVYRQRERELQTRIQELELLTSKPVDLSDAIDEAVREVVKRAADNQTRLKTENQALRERLRQLEGNADDDFETIEEVIQRTIENTDMEPHEMEQKIDILASQLLASETNVHRLEQSNSDNMDRVHELERELEALRIDMQYCMQDNVECMRRVCEAIRTITPSRSMPRVLR